MARIEWIKQRLENWAMWKERGEAGGRGWASQSPFLNTVVTGGYRQCMVPVDDVEASITNDAVESLRLTRGHLYETLQSIYPRGLGIKETARRMLRAESTIKAQLDQADHAIAAWLEERNSSKRSFTP
jgi:hypothetical protein